MNFKKLAFWTTLFTTAAVPLATAQNPVILQGNYVSNVFGQSNFILNPNAQTNVANVTVSSATVTRSTTTPLVATSEFNITTSTSTGYADWATRTFDAGMKNQNCEARFTYRGFSVGSTTVQIRQGSNTVAQLTLTASTDPRIASINFPCGDLSSATTLRVQQATASLTGTNEIGGIYVGLATNQANVAQAEFVGDIKFTSCPAAWTLITPTVFTSFNNQASACTVTTSGNVTNSSSGLRPEFGITSAKAGRYMITINAGTLGSFKTGTTSSANYYRLYDGISGISEEPYASIEGASATIAQYMSWRTFNVEFSGAVTNKTINIQAKTTDNQAILNAPLTISVYRFPTSSELVVTPERQNVWGGVVYTSGNQTLRSGQAASSTYYEFNNAAWNQPTLLKGKAQVSTTNSGNDLGFSIPNLPVGNYLLNITGVIASEVNSTTSNAVTECSFRIYETTTATTIGRQLMRDAYVPSVDIRDYLGAVNGVFTNTSVGTRNFRLEAAKATDNSPGTTGQCQAYASTNTTSISFTITPLDQPSNSALYVQGPILGAQTGAAIPAGYVGEVKHSATTPGCGTAAQYNDGASIALTPGIWKVTAQAVLGLTTTATINNWIVFTGPTSGNSATWRSNDFNDYSISGISIVSIPAITQPLIVKYDGTNLSYFANGSFTGSTASASGTIYTKFYRNGGTCNTVTSAITAIRLN